MERHYTIPIFVPNFGCKNRCIFCSQRKITNQNTLPTKEQINIVINKHISTIPKNSIIEIGFFGGTFTGLPIKIQENYLLTASYFVKNGPVKSIRLSTRPDFISDNVLTMLKSFNVGTIELGVQSTSDKVLSYSKRGHTKADIVRSSLLIKQYGFRLGHQLMIGLPYSTPFKEECSALTSVSLKADDARLYPVLVIKGTLLENLYKNDSYKPLGLNTAVERTAKLVAILESNGVNIIRCGLHASDNIALGKDLIAGPIHPSFRQLADSFSVKHSILEFLAFCAIKKPNIEYISFNPRDSHIVIGHAKENYLFFKNTFPAASFIQDLSVPFKSLKIKISGLKPSIITKNYFYEARLQ